MQDPRTQGFPPSEPQAADSNVGSASRPVRIPEPGVLPYSRLSLRALSANSISPSPSQRILAAGSPGQEEVLAPQPAPLGGAFQALNPPQQYLGINKSRPGDALPHNKRPPLPPSPQARLQNSMGSLNPLAAAWINPGDGSGGSGSGGRQPRILAGSVGSTGSFTEPGLLQLAAAATSGSVSGQRLVAPAHLAQYGAGSPIGSFSPGGDGLLAAAVSSEDVATAAGNPYHPQHETAMQLLLEHQQQQLQQLQQRRDQQGAAVGSSSGGRTPRQYLRSSSFGTAGMSPRTSPRASPQMSPRAPSHSSSFSRLSELGTSPGLIETSFMGMAARCKQPTSSSTTATTSRSTTLQQLMQQQQATIRAQQAQQQQQQRALQHSRSTVSFSEWNGLGSGTGSVVGTDSRSGSRPASAAGQQLSVTAAAPPPSPALDWELAQQQLRQQQQQPGLSPLGASLPRFGEGHGMKALPGRQGLHWLSRADDGESAARGLLGLPRPGLRPASHRVQQQLQQPLQQQQQQQQQQHQQDISVDNSSTSASTPGTAAAVTPAGSEDMSPPTVAVGRQGVQYDPAVLASFAAALAGTVANAVRNSSGSPLATARGSFSSRSYARQNSNSTSSFKDRSSAGASDALLRSMSRSMSRHGSYVGMPTCLICLDQLTPADFDSGEAMYLECRCKGEVALRHRQCAEKWSRIKGNTTCDVCKAPILNLPDVPPLPAPPPPPAADDRLFMQGSGLWGPLGDEPPAFADYVFDCIRVTWVVLIVCILFFELNVTRAFAMGAIVGITYVAISAGLEWLKRWRFRRRQEEAAAEWQEGLHAPLLAGQGRLHLLPV